MTDLEAQIAHHRHRIGQEPEIGAWLEIDQERIDAFAAATGDRQWIHTDPERARRESPYGTTVAHGFLTLSLLPYLTGSNTPAYLEQHYPGFRLRVNYGLDRVRFPAPVPAGARVRSRSSVQEVTQVGEAMQITCQLTVEIEGSDKPACVAEQLFRFYP